MEQYQLDLNSKFFIDSTNYSQHFDRFSKYVKISFNLEIFYTSRKKAINFLADGNKN